MWENVYSDFNYNLEFVETLQANVGIAIGNTAFEDLDYAKLDIKHCDNTDTLIQLQKYWEIFEEVKYCNACFEGEKIDEIVEQVKDALNSL